MKRAQVLSLPPQKKELEENSWDVGLSVLVADLALEGFLG
jgi:hypothetical protein